MRKAPEYAPRRRPLFTWFWRPVASVAGALVGAMVGVVGMWIVAAIADSMERVWKEAVEEERASVSGA